jgi:DNA repair protein RadA/Sms
VDGLDRVLSTAGGAPYGAAVLLGGDPGVGKSTLLIQALAGVALEGPALYLAAEENADQIGERAARLLGAIPERLFILESKNLEDGIAAVHSTGALAVVVDSISRIRSAHVEGSAGSMLQTRAVVRQLADAVRKTNGVALLVAHITKGGDLAGPKDVEHDVDCVLYFERVSEVVRRLHVAKNRFGSEAETATWNMTARGLRPLGAA